MANPELLILDEPCNGLDLFAREELLSRIGEMAHKESPTLIYVTHHTEEILPIFDHIMMLKNGKIHASGKRQQIFNEKRYLLLWETCFFHEVTSDRLAVLTKKSNSLKQKNEKQKKETATTKKPLSRYPF